jgi:hypothetical protein
MGRYADDTMLGIGGQGGGGTLPAGSGGYGGMAGAGGLVAIVGAALGAVGSFYSAKSQQNQLKSAALSADFEQSISNINARGAEQDADALIEAGHREAGRRSLVQAQQQGEAAVEQGAGGIVAGVGSAAEVQASIAFAGAQDQFDINMRAARAAGQARAQAVDQRNRGLMAGITAENLRASARTINPVLAAMTSLIGSGSSIGGMTKFGAG